MRPESHASCEGYDNGWRLQAHNTDALNLFCHGRQVRDFSGEHWVVGQFARQIGFGGAGTLACAHLIRGSVQSAAKSGRATAN